MTYTRFNPATIPSTYDAITALTTNFNDIAALLDLALMRDGSSPNSLLANLDLNHFKLNNLGDAVNPGDATSLANVKTLLGTGALLTVAATGFGALGDGTTNDAAGLLAALQYAATYGLWVDGMGKTYGVSGTFELPPVVKLRNLTIKQLSTALGDFRPIYSSGGTHIELEKVTVNMGTNGNAGSLNNAAGIWIDTCSVVHLRDVEVTGNAFGSGIAVINCAKAFLDRPYVHDVLGGSSTQATLTNDAVQGIFLSGCDMVVVAYPRVENIKVQWTGQAAINKFTRGLSFSGNKAGCLIGPQLDNVDQGCDISGNGNDTRLSIHGGEARNCYSWGFKAANTVTRTSFHGTTAWRCGISGFVVSAAALGESPNSGNITYHGCTAVETGYGGVWVGSATISGFRILSTTDFPTQPQGVKYFGCQAHADGAPMQYGFFSDAALPTAAPFNSNRDCMVSGATVAPFSGFSFQSSLLAHCATTTTATNDTTMIFDTKDRDSLSEYNNTTGVWTSKITGKVNVTANWSATLIPAGAGAGLSIRKNSALVVRRSTTNPGTSASDVSVDIVATIPVVPGDTIDIHSYTNGTTFSVNVSAAYFSNLSIEQVE